MSVDLETEQVDHFTNATNPRRRTIQCAEIGTSLACSVVIDRSVLTDHGGVVSTGIVGLVVSADKIIGPSINVVVVEVGSILGEPCKGSDASDVGVSGMDCIAEHGVAVRFVGAGTCQGKVSC